MFTHSHYELVAGCTVSFGWRRTRFFASQSQGGFVLTGYPLAAEAAVHQRLVALGATVSAQGRCQGAGHLGWSHFSCSAAVAAYLALLFAAPAGATPLVITGSGSIGKRRGCRSVVQHIL